MKRFNKTAAMLLALFTLGFVASGCGKSDDGGQGGGGGSSSTSTVVYQPYAGGPATIYFTVSNAYYSGVVLSMGQLMTNVSLQWPFANNIRPNGSGNISLNNGQMGYPSNQQNQAILSGTGIGGTRLTVAVQPGSDQFHSNVVYGQLEISSNDVQRMYGYNATMPNVIGLTIDVGVAGTTLLGGGGTVNGVGGGILIYTSQDSSGYHGKYLAF